MMMRNISLLLCVVIMTLGSTHAQSPTGIWKTIDDNDGKVKSHISITEEDGKLHGTIVKLVDADRDICTACKDELKDRPLLGMQIMHGLKPDGELTWSGGKIMDPKTGKTYKCNLKLESDDELKVRGYIGFSLLGRTQTWYRVED